MKISMRLSRPPLLSPCTFEKFHVNLHPCSDDANKEVHTVMIHVFLNKMKRLSISGLLISIALSVSGQASIETRLCFADTTGYPFSGEWQYLSTDIYLFNGDKFNKVINDLYLPANKKGKKRGASNEELEYLYITAQLVNVKYFGDNDIVYPLFNFKIGKDANEKYRTFVNDNIENVRIIDNLPLYAANNKIDAKIDVKALTYNDRDNILGFFGRQLQNLAGIGSAGFPVMSLIGEMGNFIESNTKKKEYRFSSTIRLFEQKNFDVRLHSVRVYAMVTPNTPMVRMNTKPLENFLDTCRYSELSRALLNRLIDYRAYPLIVVANYKSLYKMQSISGDEVNFANIDRRKVSIENNYRDKLINEDTYKQEKKFIDFLTVFANFKNQLELYTLNARTGNRDGAGAALTGVVQAYVSLLQEYEVINFKYRGDKIFNTAFKTEYSSIIDFASFYLENDHNLRGVKSMCNTLTALNKNGMPTKSEEKENALRSLRYIDNMNNDFKTKIKEGQNINAWTEQMESALFNQFFKTDIDKLNASPTAPGEKNKDLQLLNEKIAATPCKPCREKATETIKNYYDRLETLNRNEKLNVYLATIKLADSEIVAGANKLKLLKGNMATVYVDTASLDYETYNRKIAEIERDIRNLEGLTNSNIDDKPSHTIESMSEKINSAINAVRESFEFVQKNNPALLDEIQN